MRSAIRGTKEWVGLSVLIVRREQPESGENLEGTGGENVIGSAELFVVVVQD